MAGYIKLYRDIQQHWLFLEKREFSRYEAWTDILLRVNHTAKKISQNGKPELVERGSTIWSMGEMEARWGWSNRKVKRFLDCLVGDQMLVYKSTTKKTYLTVVNYDKYQGSDMEEAPPKHHESISNAYQKHTNKNEKNEKKEIKDLCAEIENFRARYSPELLSTLDNYLDFIRETRKNKRISDSVKLKILSYFSKYSPTQVEYAIKTHMGMPDKSSAREEYTFGIIRNSTEEEAAKKLVTLGTKLNGRAEPVFEGLSKANERAFRMLQEARESEQNGDY